MAKKKRKPVNHKQSQRTHLSKMSSTDVFAAQAKECFKEQIRNAKENENIVKPFSRVSITILSDKRDVFRPFLTRLR